MGKTVQASLPPMEVRRDDRSAGARSTSDVAEGSRESTPVDHGAVARSQAVDRSYALLRRCVSDGQWTLDALAAHMGIDKAHISRVLNGEKRATLDFMASLPHDVKVLFAMRCAEAFGLVVVAPLEGPAAAKALVAGLLGVLAPRERKEVA